MIFFSIQTPAQEIFKNIQNFKKVGISVGYDRATFFTNYENVNIIKIRAKLENGKWQKISEEVGKSSGKSLMKDVKKKIKYEQNGLKSSLFTKL